MERNVEERDRRDKKKEETRVPPPPFASLQFRDVNLLCSARASLIHSHFSKIFNTLGIFVTVRLLNAGFLSREIYDPMISLDEFCDLDQQNVNLLDL